MPTLGLKAVFCLRKRKPETKPQGNLQCYQLCYTHPINKQQLLYVLGFISYVIRHMSEEAVDMKVKKDL